MFVVFRGAKTSVNTLNIFFLTMHTIFKFYFVYILGRDRELVGKGRTP